MLAAALGAGVPYVGLVASRRRGAAVVADLDVDEAERARVRTPAGLDIGARTPAEVALSILAEIVAVRPRRAVAALAPPEIVVGTATDPVCGMSVAMVESSLHLDHDGRRLLVLRSGLPGRLHRRPRPLRCRRDRLTP